MSLRCHRCDQPLRAQHVCPEGVDPRPCLAPDGSPLVGRTLAGRYSLLEVLGVGGMGTVFRARQEAVGREVAIKILPRHLAEDTEAIRQFAHEARVLGRLSEPHVVTVYDFGRTEDGLIFLVMELLQGRSLAAELAAAGNLSPRRALPIVRQVADALGHAHELGIVHRDVKAQNIVLLENPWGRDIVKVLDFGIAVLMLGSAGFKDRSGFIVGTPETVSPEQVLGQVIDARTDVYSLGVVTFQMLAGRVPVTGETPADIFRAKAAMERPPRLRDVRPDLEVPPLVEELVARMLEPDRDRRIATMREVRAGITRALRSVEAGADRRRDSSTFRKVVEAVTGLTAGTSSTEVRDATRVAWELSALALRTHRRVVRAYREAADACPGPIGHELLLDLAVAAGEGLEQVEQVQDRLAAGEEGQLLSVKVDDTPFDKTLQRLMAYPRGHACGGDGRAPMQALQSGLEDLRGLADQWERHAADAGRADQRRFASAMLRLAREHLSRVDELLVHLEEREIAVADTVRDSRARKTRQPG